MKKVILLFWIGFGIYLIGLFLPYRIETSFSAVNAGVIVKNYESGIEHIAPLFSLIPLILLIIFSVIRHSNFTRWACLLLAISLVFPALPFYFFTTSLCFYCESEQGAGFYLHCVASLLILIAMIAKIRVPVTGNKNVETEDLLDNF